MAHVIAISNLKGGIGKTTTAFNADGLPTTVDDFGDEAVSGDETCVRTTYARNDTLWIIETVSQSEKVHLAVYDIAGRLVRTLVNRQVPGGAERAVVWDGNDRFGVRVRSGVYYYRIVTPTFTHTRKMTMIK